MAAANSFFQRGMRERILRLLGSGDLYDQLSSLRQQVQHYSEATMQAGECRDRVERPGDEDVGSAAFQTQELLRGYRESAADLDDRRQRNLIIELDYPAASRTRYGWGQPDEPRLLRLIQQRWENYQAQLQAFEAIIPSLARVANTTADASEPFWRNEWFPPFDALSLYGYLALRKPSHYVEIGSGNSTKFARKAVADYGLRTTITSIDPHPRAEIDKICDVVIRYPLEDAPQDVFRGLVAGDVLFFDGSHRALQNSDVTVFFTEILPDLPSGVLVGIHDTFLPADYPPEWEKRFYSEQYLLACWLLAGDRLQIELPVWFCASNESLFKIPSALWQSPNLEGCHITGGAFWFSIR